jgi:hypothetical protein
VAYKTRMLAWGPWDACWASSCARPVWATWVLAQNWIGADIRENAIRTILTAESKG